MISKNRLRDALNHGMEHAAAIERGEPTYEFQKGVGWVPYAEPRVIRVTGREIQVGDVLLNWKFTSGATRTGGDWCVVLSVTDTHVGTQNPHFHTLDEDTPLGRVEWFEVRRK